MTLQLRCAGLLKKLNKKKIEESVQVICIRMKDDWDMNDDGMKSVYYLICRNLERFGRDSILSEFNLESDDKNLGKMKNESIKIFDDGKTEPILHIHLNKTIIDRESIEEISIYGRIITANGSVNERKKFWSGSKSVFKNIKMISNEQDLRDLGISFSSREKSIHEDQSTTSEDVKERTSWEKNHDITRGRQEKKPKDVFTKPGEKRQNTLQSPTEYEQFHLRQRQKRKRIRKKSPLRENPNREGGKRRSEKLNEDMIITKNN